MLPKRSQGYSTFGQKAFSSSTGAVGSIVMCHCSGSVHVYHCVFKQFTLRQGNMTLEQQLHLNI